MSDTMISIEHVSKSYKLGVINTGTFKDDMKVWIARAQGKPNPLAKVDEFERPNQEDVIWALRDINITINRGEAVGIIGRNGAGKSTLLKILSRVTTPTSGHVRMRGRIVSLLEVGTGFHPELTGRENIFMNGAIMGMTRSEVLKKFDEIVDFSGVEKFIDTPVKRYSSGMYVRLAFAVAAHLEPEILIVDEVLAVGDAEFQKKCLGKMGNAASEGRTVLFVSHNMAAIANLCNRSVLLSDGSLLASGNSKDMIALYLNSLYSKQSGEIDLCDPQKALRRNSLANSYFKLTGIQIINQRGIITSHIGLNEPFEMNIFGELNRDVDDLIISYGVISIQGGYLFNSHSIDSKMTQKFSKGKLGFNIKFEKNFLAPGSYIIEIGAKGKGIIDYIPEAIKINIEEATNMGETLSRTNYDGVIIHPCQWSIIE